VKQYCKRAEEMFFIFHFSGRASDPSEEGCFCCQRAHRFALGSAALAARGDLRAIYVSLESVKENSALLHAAVPQGVCINI